jgi:hypothetical protein
VEPVPGSVFVLPVSLLEQAPIAMDISIEKTIIFIWFVLSCHNKLLFFIIPSVKNHIFYVKPGKEDTTK